MKDDYYKRFVGLLNLLRAVEFAFILLGSVLFFLFSSCQTSPGPFPIDADDSAFPAILELGKRNHLDREFAQSKYQQVFHAAIQNTSAFPKELNTTFHNQQYIDLPLNVEQAKHGLTIELFPAWNDGKGGMQISVDVWCGSDWITTDHTFCNKDDPGYLHIYPAYLSPGTNAIRLRALQGTADTAHLTWDQIRIMPQTMKEVWLWGDNNNLDTELKQSDFQPINNAFEVSDRAFPKELNLDWHPIQDIGFSLSREESQSPHYLNLDVCWNNGQGDLRVALETWNNKDWEKIGEAWLNSTKPGVIEIPADYLWSGRNRWRLHAIGGRRGTSAAVWDWIGLYRRTEIPDAVLILLRKILDVSLNYFLNPASIHPCGFPLTALKAGNRSRYGYSNPTEWGLALEAWIAAAEIGKISRNEACDRINTCLQTMADLQDDSDQFKYGLFYPYYTMVNPDNSYNDFPFHDAYHELPSGDCALLWGSLNIVQGWALYHEFTATASLAGQIKAQLDFRYCYSIGSNGLAGINMLINADNGTLGPWTWRIWSDEGGIVNMISYLAGSTDLNEFGMILAAQERPSCCWQHICIQESALFNAAFTWPQRALMGIPMLDDPVASIYGLYSFLPAARSHYAYAKAAGVDYVGFSDAMTQTWEGKPMVGRYIPPNIPGITEPNPPAHIQPHGNFVWMAALDTLEDSLIRKAFNKAVLLKNDINNYWHTAYDPYPFGFEVNASPYMNVPEYHGADEGRNIFEALSKAYTVISIYDGLQRIGDGHTMTFFAAQVPGFSNEVQRLLKLAYPEID